MYSNTITIDNLHWQYFHEFNIPFRKKNVKFDFRPYSAFKFGGRNRRPKAENFRFWPKISASGIPLHWQDGKWNKSVATFTSFFSFRFFWYGQLMIQISPRYMIWTSFWRFDAYCLPVWWREKGDLLLESSEDFITRLEQVIHI